MEIKLFRGFILDKSDNRSGCIEVFKPEDSDTVSCVFHHGDDIHNKPFRYDRKKSISLSKCLNIYSKQKQKLGEFIDGTC